MENNNVKLAIRADRKAGVILASITDFQESELLTISTFSLRVADKNRAAFEAWVKGVDAAFREILEDVTGLKVLDTKRFNQKDKN